MISELLPITLASLPLVYLGVPIFLGTSRHSYFNQLLHSIRARLDGWKAKCLSSAGRLIMVKHVLSSIPVHISFVIPIPSKTSSQIEHLMRNFLWSSSSEKKKRSNMVKWDLVCVPKAEGGLGLRRLKEVNDGCLLNLGWIAATSDSLWSTWFVADISGTLLFGSPKILRQGPASGKG